MVEAGDGGQGGGDAYRTRHSGAFANGGGISEGVKKWVNKFSLTPINNVSRTVMAAHTGGGIWDFALTASAEVVFSGGDDGLVIEVRRWRSACRVVGVGGVYVWGGGQLLQPSICLRL